MEKAFHCTNIEPTILMSGFESGVGGFTISNNVQWLYEKFLPKNPMFVSNKPWDENTKYCIELDIESVELFPDFGHLIDVQAEFDEDYIFWRDDDIYFLKKMVQNGNKDAKIVLDWITTDLDDYTISVEDFTGDLSWDILGTAAINADIFDFNKRILEISTS